MRKFVLALLAFSILNATVVVAEAKPAPYKASKSKSRKPAKVKKVRAKSKRRTVSPKPIKRK